MMNVCYKANIHIFFAPQSKNIDRYTFKGTCQCEPVVEWISDLSHRKISLTLGNCCAGTFFTLPMNTDRKTIVSHGKGCETAVLLTSSFLFKKCANCSQFPWPQLHPYLYSPLSSLPEHTEQAVGLNIWVISGVSSRAMAGHGCGAVSLSSSTARP